MRALFITAVLGILLASSCTGPAEAEATKTEFVLGTVCTIRILEGPTSGVHEEIFERLRQIEDRMSANKDGTEIAAVNAAAGESAVAVSPDTLYVLKKALEYARLTGGAFDPTVGPLVKLWGIGTDEARVPSPAEISQALALIDWRKVEIDERARTVLLAAPHMRLDLGAIAKGYAADEVKRILGENKVRAAVVDLGGNVYVFGKKKDGKPWRVGIQDPQSERGDYLGIVTGFEEAVVTSGVYERFFIQDGKRYHHILDTKTGYPVDNGLLSVSIIGGSSIDADGLSTSLFALGRERGLALAETLPGIEVVMIDSDHRIWTSSGANKVFSLTNEGYHLAE